MMEEKKICFKCGRELPLSHFYKHSKMADGYLNKCKDCTKNDVKKRYDTLSKDENYMEKERARGREKYKRLSYNLKNFKSTTKLCPIEKTIASRLRRVGYDTNGKEAHHWNYNYPKSIILLPRKIHKLIHKYIYVNYEDKLCYTIENVSLDSKSKTEKYYNDILENNEINMKVEFIEL